MKHVDKKRIPSIILLIDFSEAFNSINHDYIQNVLSLHGFGPSILNWFKKFFSIREATVLMKGIFTKRIFLRQGVPQGDIISHIFLS